MSQKHIITGFASLTLGNRSRYRGIPFIETPIDEKDGDPPHLYRHSDATPIELFFDLFFVANLSTFTATHEIHNVEGVSDVMVLLLLILNLTSMHTSAGCVHWLSRSDMVYLAPGDAL